MDFEWDEAKALKNETKHGLSFSKARQSFFNPGVDIPDTRKDYGEDRINRCGRLDDGSPVVICFTIRARKIRLISARPAKREERDIIP
jgi:uncharacterized DUF497 family protein